MEFLEQQSHLIGFVVSFVTISVFATMFLWDRFKYKKKLRNERFARRIERSEKKVRSPRSFFEDISKDLITSFREKEGIEVQSEGDKISIIYLPTNKKMVEITYSEKLFKKPIKVIFGVEGEESYPKSYTLKEMSETLDPMKKIVLDLVEEMTHEEV